MKTLELFVVELEKQLKDTIKTDSGFELIVDSKFKDFEHRVTDGPVGVLATTIRYRSQRRRHLYTSITLWFLMRVKFSRV